MKFKNKLKARLFVSIAFMVFGIALIAVSFITKTENHFISSYGLALLVMGMARTKKHFRITKNEDNIRKAEISESDERNISINQKARGAAFSTYLMLSCLAVIVLSFLAMHEAATWISLSVLLLLVIYWVFYFVYQKIS